MIINCIKKGVNIMDGTQEGHPLSGANASLSSVALHGRINHSLVIWPFQEFGEKWDRDSYRNRGGISTDGIPGL